MGSKLYTVNEIVRYINNMVRSDYVLKNVSIKGEVSNCKYHSSGHIYFSIKDELASVACIIYKSTVPGLSVRPENGKEVIVKGNFSIYEKAGQLTCQVTEVKESKNNVGILYARFNALKEKLYEEGLFDFEKKKQIPAFPKTVGIVTAETGAAIQDIINVTKRRNPYVQLILYPAKVQGEGAAKTIIEGIKALDAMKVDTIIIGRGGGTIEDLWAFNDEELARCIYECNTPIISGTGHEIDNTIADYVADLRAPTPSAAAEQAVPDVMSYINKAHYLKRLLDGRIDDKMNSYRLRVNSYSSGIERISPENKLKDEKARLALLSERLNSAADVRVTDAYHKLEVLSISLHGLSPTAKLINGFGYISKNGEALSDIKSVSPGEKIDITIRGGEINAEVLNVKHSDIV